MVESHQEARRIITELARAVDRKLTIEVRDVPGQERLQVTLQHGTHQGHIELPIPGVLAAADDAVARNELRLRIKRANDTMLFRTPPDHRLAVTPVAPPGGQTTFRSPRGRGRR